MAADNRFLELPDDLLRKIISKLDMKTVVSTCLVCRELSQLWLTIKPPSLLIHEGEVPCFFPSPEFDEFRERTTLTGDEAEGNLFINLRCNYGDHLSEISKWIFFASTYKASGLKLQKAIITSIPFHHFKRLELFHCLDLPNTIRLVNLEYLTVIKSSFEYPSKFSRILIHTPKLHYFDFDNWDFSTSNNKHIDFLLFAPKLKTMKMKGHFFKRYNIVGMNSVDNVYLDMTCGESSDNFSEGETANATRMSRLLKEVARSATHLTLLVPAFQDFPELVEVNEIVYAFIKLKRLAIQIRNGCLHEMKFIKSLVCCAPILEMITIIVEDEFDDLKDFAAKILTSTRKEVQIVLKSATMTLMK